MDKIINEWAPYCFFVSEKAFDGFDEAIKAKGFMSGFRDSFENIYDSLDELKNEKVKRNIEQILLEYPKVFVDPDTGCDTGGALSKEIENDFKSVGLLKLPFPKITLFMGAYVNAGEALRNGDYWSNGFYATQDVKFSGKKFDGAYSVFLEQMSDRAVGIHLFVAKGAENLSIGLYSCVMSMDETDKVYMINPPNIVSKNTMQGLFNDVVRAVHKLTLQEGSVYIAKPTPKEVQVNRKKLAKRKSFLVEFRLIKIEPRKIQLPSMPHGTHASPRQHWRRGHWRTYASGKRVFVNPMLVGDEKNGKIVKDYVVGGSVGAH